ncbi:MAG: hypothetical protein FVQ81_14670 [Candidatus Glassbacteria bacterium]|nr:hypothetical protein [Candidatus Glassbacteria bacterium]
MSDNKNTAVAGTLEKLGERRSDFWWNLVYFLILAIAIGFVLVNNDLASIISPAGIGILAVLGVLELYPTFYLVKLVLRLKNGRRDS